MMHKEGEVWKVARCPSILERGQCDFVGEDATENAYGGASLVREGGGPRLRHSKGLLKAVRVNAVVARTRKDVH